MKHVGLPAAALLLAWSPAGGQAPEPAPERIFVLSIGVDKFADAGKQWLSYAHRDAELFGRLKPGLATVLDDNKATRTNILNALDSIVQKAGPHDEVRLFISSSGQATVHSQEGFIATVEGHGEKPTTTIQLSDLKKFLLNVNARRVFLFADVSREQPVNGIDDNRINLVLRKMSKDVPRLVGLLASEPGTASLEDRDLQGGYGLFGYFLVNGLEGGRVGLDRVLEYLLSSVPAWSRKMARPQQTPMPVTKVAPAVLITQAIPRGRRGRTPENLVLLAQNGQAPPGSLAGANSPVLDPEAQALLEQLPDSLEKLLAKLASIREPAARSQIAVGLEDAGQRIFAQYGTGDQFPEDPRRLSAKDFQRAADLFDEARKLREEAPPVAPLISVCGKRVIRDRADIRSLEARYQFCLGRALLSDEMKRGLDVPQPASDSLSCAAALEPGWPEPKNATGIVKLLSGHPDQAAVDFKAALQLAPNWAYPRHNLALAYVEQGFSADAEREYREAIQRTPYYPYLYYNLGLLLQRQNRKKEAEKEYLMSLDWFDGQIARYQLRGARLEEDREPARAALNRKIADTLIRNRAEAENALGTLEQDLKKDGEAERHFLAALRLNADLSPARHNLGLLYSRMGRTDEAMDQWIENSKRDPGFHPSRLKLADALFARNRFSAARTEYDAVLNQYPENTSARLGSAAALEGDGDIPAAVGALRAATANQRSNPEVAIRLGDLLAKQSNKTAACAEYRRAEALSKQSVLADKGGLKRRLNGCPVS